MMFDFSFQPEPYNEAMINVEVDLRIDSDLHPANDRVTTHQAQILAVRLYEKGNVPIMDDQYLLSETKRLFFQFYEDDAINQFLNER